MKSIDTLILMGMRMESVFLFQLTESKLYLSKLRQHNPLFFSRFLWEEYTDFSVLWCSQNGNNTLFNYS